MQVEHGVAAEDQRVGPHRRDRRRLALSQHGDKVRRGQVIVVSLVDAADHDFGIDARLAQEAQSGRRAGGED